MRRDAGKSGGPWRRTTEEGVGTTPVTCVDNVCVLLVERMVVGVAAATAAESMNVGLGELEDPGVGNTVNDAAVELSSE